MDADDPATPEPDVASLFAPVAVEETFGGVLTEARQVLGQLDDPVDAELWGSDLIGALASSAAGLSSLMDTLTKSLVPAAEAAATPEALALLRVLAAVGSPALRTAAGQAAARLSAHDVADPPWAAAIGAPQVGDCWHYADVGGRQESLTMTFAYGEQAARRQRADRPRPRRQDQGHLGRQGVRPARRHRAGGRAQPAGGVRGDRRRRRPAPAGAGDQPRASAPSSPTRSTTWWRTARCCAPASTC